MQRPILYSFRRCPYAMRARLAIYVSELNCELREVVLANKPQELRDASPKATVPVLVLADGQVIDQSLDIMRYALKINDPFDWLRVENALEMALIDENDTAFKSNLDRYKYPSRYNVDPFVYREAGMMFLKTLDQKLARTGYLSGTDYALVDIAILPFVRQFFAVDEAWMKSQPIANVRNWLEQFLAGEMFEKVMQTFPVWARGHEPVFFPASSI